MTPGDRQTAQHAGWLLACDSPANIAKGRRLFATLPPKGQEVATAYEAECNEVYSSAATKEDRT